MDVRSKQLHGGILLPDRLTIIYIVVVVVVAAGIIVVAVVVVVVVVVDLVSYLRWDK